MRTVTERTSLSNPLEICEIACGGGVLGLTLCPGKVASSYAGAPWRRDLALDLDRVVAWGAGMVVTLMGDQELRGMNVRDLGASVRDHGMEWIQLPIVDGAAPDGAFERRWAVFGHLIRSRLTGGERVLIHCRGGLGRAGTVAAQLLIEGGMTPVAAVAAVRAARPGAVETRAQETYLADLADLTPPPRQSQHADRLIGCLLGGAVGDAFGYAVEFTKLPEILRTYGPDGLTEPELQNGKLVVSDDTQMTLFTAEALTHTQNPGHECDVEAAAEGIRRGYLKWYATQVERWHGPGSRPGRMGSFPELWARRAPGNTCLSALAAGGRGAIERPINNSKGCGGVMRVAPIGLYLQLTPVAAFDLAARAAAFTHGHPLGYLSAGAFAHLIRQLVAGVDLLVAVEATLAHTAEWANSEDLVLILRRAVELAGDPSICPRNAIARLGEGWVGEEALAIALFAAMRGGSFREALALGANHNGDSDSTASIAGQIWGAVHGTAGIPVAWTSSLDVLDPLCEILRGMERLSAALR